MHTPAETADARDFGWSRKRLRAAHSKTVIRFQAEQSGARRDGPTLDNDWDQNNYKDHVEEDLTGLRSREQGNDGQVNRHGTAQPHPRHEGGLGAIPSERQQARHNRSRSGEQNEDDG